MDFLRQHENGLLFLLTLILLTEVGPHVLPQMRRMSGQLRRNMFRLSRLSLILFVTGAAANDLSSYANDGKMPVRIVSPSHALEVAQSAKYQPLTPESRLPLLADIMYFPRWMPIWGHSMVSVGDLMLLTACIAMCLWMGTVVAKTRLNPEAAIPQ